MAPPFVIFVKPLLKVTGWASTLIARRYRKKLTPESQKKLLKSIVIVGGTTISVTTFMSMEYDTFNSRFRLFFLSKDAEDQIGNSTRQQILGENYEKSLPSTTSEYIRCNLILKRLMNSYENVVRPKWKHNNMLQPYKTDYKLFVVHDDDTINAFSTPNFDIYITTGMIMMIELWISNNKSRYRNLYLEESLKVDDIIAFLLAHEMSHAILRHSNERFSLSFVIEAIKTTLITFLSFNIPLDGAYEFFNYYLAYNTTFGSKIENFLVHLPYSREHEREADRLGLLISTSACYDAVDGAENFFAYLARKSKNSKHDHNHDKNSSGGKDTTTTTTSTTTNNNSNNNSNNNNNNKEDIQSEGDYITYTSTHPTDLERQRNASSSRPSLVPYATTANCSQMKQEFLLSHKAYIRNNINTWVGGLMYLDRYHHAGFRKAKRSRELEKSEANK